jgi:hypothetical protein
MKNQTIIYGLGLAGLIPFVGAAIAALAGWQIMGTDPQTLFLTYSAIILSFLAGSLWGMSRELPENTLSSGLLIFSNVVALLAWLSLILGKEFYATGLTISILAYTAMYAVELSNAKRLFNAEAKVYLKLRLFLTTVVCLSHVVMLLV